MSQTATSDRATDFARAVVAGEIVAGPDVRHACARHLRDLELGPARGLTWDLAAAQHAIGYFEEVLCLNGGEFEGQPFVVLPWQAFVIGVLFGWMGPDGYRRFRVAYVETGKGSGKSPLAAGVGLFGMTADHEPRAEIYAAATKKDQAMILFRDAVAMVDQSPLLTERIDKAGRGENVWNLAYLDAASFFRPISADDGQSGPRPHIALLDEIHEHRSRTVVEMMRAGTKSRRQAMIFMITNSGTDKRTVCWDYHDYGIKVCAAGAQGAGPDEAYFDDSFFAFICSLDEGDDPFRDEACWPKVNPSLAFGKPGDPNGGVPGYKYLREQVTQARGMPAKESMVRRLNFCQWVEAETPWISSEVWMRCRRDRAEDVLLMGRRCWGALDLSSTTDLTSLTAIFEPSDADPLWRVRQFFWVPGDGLHEKSEHDRVPYIAWRDAGYLEALPGRAVKKLAVLHRLVSLHAQFGFESVAYDRWRIEDLLALAETEGLDLPPMVSFGQGYKDMSPAVEELERMLVEAELVHEGNPVLTWCAANAVTTSDPAGNRKIAKDRATGRVDGIVTLTMAVGQSMKRTEDVLEPEIVIL